LVHFIWPGIKNKLETDLKMWMNHTLEDTCPSSRSPRCNAGIYRFITKKTFKKPDDREIIVLVLALSHIPIATITTT
jgi:hypothetical protein